MARKQTSQPPPPPPLRLLMPRDEATQRIITQKEKGLALIQMPLNSMGDIEKLKAEKSKWVDYTAELLKRLFSNETLANEFAHIGYSVSMRPSPQEVIRSQHEQIKRRITILESILERLELIPEPEAQATSVPSSQANAPLSRDVFVVHGHDEAAKEPVARFVEKLGLRSVILHEQPNQGRTIIEKFERHADVGFAIVLLTPDDIGAPISEPENGRPRPRQNVVFELGYFIGRLGRQRVCALVKGDIEILSDYLGVVYLPMDEAGGWRLQLAKEIKEAEIDIDLNRAF